MSTTLICSLIALFAALLSRVNHPSERFTKNLVSTSAYLAVAIGSFAVIDFFMFKLTSYELGKHVGAMLGGAVPLIFLKGSALDQVTFKFSAQKLAVLVWLGLVVLGGLFAYSVSEQFGDHRAKWEPVATSQDPKLAGVLNYYFDPSSAKVADETRSVRILMEWPRYYDKAGNSSIGRFEIQCGKNKIRQIYSTTYDVTNDYVEVVSRSFEEMEVWTEYPVKSIFWMVEQEVCSLSLKET
jgi:hypothetical protein